MNSGNIPRVMIAAPASGSGKTTVTCALLYGIKRKRARAVSFKCGPDFIDPAFHTGVLGVASSNLDLFLTGEETCKYLLCKNAEGADIAVIEGVMGYYDGLGAETLYSSYHLARVTGTPVIVVVNCKGLSLTVAALLNGLSGFREDSGIKGVILNNVSERLFPLYKEIIEKETNVRVIGYLPDLPDCRFESRNMGLAADAEAKDLNKKLRKLADAAEKTIDFDTLFEIAREASAIEYDAPAIQKKFSVTIAVAMDKAFCFYYRDALELLAALGADIEYFSPLTDEKMPECDGFILGGGYPERYLSELGANQNMIADIKAKISKGIPYLAESGGFMILFDTIAGIDESPHKMVGAISGEAFITKKLTRFGYMTLTAKRDNIFCRKGESINAHEFHYSDTTNNGGDFIAEKPVSGGKSWDCIFADEKRFAGYPHIHLLGNIRYAENFLRACQTEKEKR